MAATVARPPHTAGNIHSERLSELNPQRDTPTRQQRGEQRVTRQGRCPREGVEAVRALLSHWLPTRKRSERLRAVHRAPPLRGEAMEAAVRRRRPRPEERSAADGERPPALSGQSYWLDLWLFVLFDAALFVFIYLLP